MTNDKTLLEMAARAAGMRVMCSEAELHGCMDASTVYRGMMLEGEHEPWNPLDDDGDALRLAVKLDINVFQSSGSAYALPSYDDGTYEMQARYCDIGGDPCAATRLAIVRAAAEIGRTTVESND